jgi:hypothetical protein
MNNVIGLDLGMGATKLWSAAGGKTILSQVAMPTREDIDLKALGMSAKRKPTVILNGMGRLLVGEGAHDAGTPIERLDYERLTGSPEMKALVYAALATQDTSEDNPIALMVGLPLGLAAGDESKRRIDAVKAWLTGAHVWKADKREHVAVVERVGCVSQAHAAYLDWLLNDDGKPMGRPVKGREIAVISVGFNTIEMVVLRDNQAVSRFVAGEKLGVRRFLELVNEGRRGLFSLGELDIRLRSGGLNEPAAQGKWAAQVHGHIERTWSDAAGRFDHVIAVGGGSLLLRDALVDLFGNRLIESDEPVLSVARGLYKFGLMQKVKEAAK